MDGYSIPWDTSSVCVAQMCGLLRCHCDTCTPRVLTFAIQAGAENQQLLATINDMAGRLDKSVEREEAAAAK